jgi:predicted secreted protein
VIDLDDAKKLKDILLQIADSNLDGKKVHTVNGTTVQDLDPMNEDHIRIKIFNLMRK